LSQRRIARFTGSSYPVKIAIASAHATMKVASTTAGRYCGMAARSGRLR